MEDWLRANLALSSSWRHFCVKSEGRSINIKVVVHKAEEGGFWAEVPELAGCASQGETMDDLMANIREAIEAWFASEEPETSETPERKVIELTL